MKFLVRSGFLLLMVLGFYLPLGFAGIVTGEVTGHWTLENSPFIADSDITIPGGGLLTIDPGVTVQFDPGTSILIDGDLEASGTADHPIVFCGTIINLDTAVWNGMTFDHATSYCHLSNAIVSNTANPITMQTSSVDINNCRISGYCTGITANSSLVDVDNSTVSIITGSLNPTGTASSTGIIANFSKLDFHCDTIYVSAEQFNLDACGLYTTGGTVSLDSSMITVYATHNASGINASGIDTANFVRNIILMNSRVQNTGFILVDMGWQSYVYQNTVRYWDETPVIAVSAQRNRGIHFRNNVFWGSSIFETLSHGLEGRTSNLIDWDYNLLYGFNQNYVNALAGTHDILADPMLNPVDFKPNSGSPVIDAGDTSLPWDADGTPPDIGAVPYRVNSVSEQGLLPNTLKLQTYPNPFNSTIRISVPATGKVSWHVYDRLGRLVTAGNGIATNASYVTEWHPTAGIVSGWYTLEIITQKGVARRTLCYLR